MAQRLSCKYHLLAAVCWLLVSVRGESQTASVPRQPAEIRFKFHISPKTPFADLLPIQPKVKAKRPHWKNEDLDKVPELEFGEPISKELPNRQAMEAIAHTMAKINHLNRTKTDGFMLAMIEQRSDLRGLPFLMGDDCRMDVEKAKAFASVAERVRGSLGTATIRGGENSETRGRFWGDVSRSNFGVKGIDENLVESARVAALTQVLMAESGHFQFGLAQDLARVSHMDATKALARLAIFSHDEDARGAAIDALGQRPEKDYTEILLQGLRYPLPVVSKRAAEAIVHLKRKEVLANLIEILESPDPRLPMTVKRGDENVFVVRELVRVNHHRNCLLCHAPANTDQTPKGVLAVAVPLPGELLPEAAEYYPSTPQPSPDIFVRLDMTYLRQDFSQMMPVSDSNPWPRMQRFDFLVRTRTLTDAEAKAYEPCCEDEETGRLSPYHRAALFALRELTGRDTEPTAAAWRKLLKLSVRN